MIRPTFLIFIWSSLTALSGATSKVEFNKDIRPILSNKCFQCHGPDEHGRKGKLRLDRADGKHGAYGSAIKPGDLEDSEIWYRITTDDADDVMPPSDSHVEALTPKERELLKQWVMDGADYEDFWAFLPAKKHELPALKDAQWSDQAIDSFVLASLEGQGASPKVEADKRTLIRRVSFDITGLPPTVGEIDAFVADRSEDAYKKLVDRLLAKDQYGEHMAKYWLDLVRFADTNGMHHDHYRDMTPYRDWVIRSFNENLSFDQFVVDQVAGDLHADPTTDQLIASGFNRLHLIIDAGTALPEESFTKNVIDRVSSVGTAFMGLTLQCAVCHDHKFDPITQKDFFQMYAFFNNFDGQPETGRRGTPDFNRGLQPPYINLPTPDEELALKAIDEKLVALGDKVSKPEKKKLEDQRAKIRLSMRAALVMKERAEPRPAHILLRGAYDNPGEQVERGTPGFLPPLKSEGDLKTRMDLAKWLVESSNPLTARVAVNRFWQQFFGVGLVKTSEDFGAQGEWPSHPKLLDHLTLSFVESGWDVKALVRGIVLSKTYRQSSTAAREEFINDPENRLLSRGSRFRLDSEMIRDQILAASGMLNPEMHGRSVKPPQPEGLWKIVAMPYSYPREYKPDSGDQIYRRSIYTFWKRGLPPPQMSIFDAPNRDSCIARRERTNTPLQALLLMNEEQFFTASKHLVNQLFNDRVHCDTPSRLRLAYETITSKNLDGATLRLLEDSLKGFEDHYKVHPKEAADIWEADDPADSLSRAAWTMVVHTLFNLDSVKTRE
ncbi:MAG: hypothetical protein ACI8XO_005055 [Verrucomicrobiales bacterium]|jgi:hypothetical protein